MFGKFHQHKNSLMVFLILFYVDRVLQDIRIVERTLPTYIRWTNKELRERQSKELMSGGFGQGQICKAAILELGGNRNSNGKRIKQRARRKYKEKSSKVPHDDQAEDDSEESMEDTYVAELQQRANEISCKILELQHLNRSYETIIKVCNSLYPENIQIAEIIRHVTSVFQNSGFSEKPSEGHTIIANSTETRDSATQTNDENPKHEMTTNQQPATFHQNQSHQQPTTSHQQPTCTTDDSSHKNVTHEKNMPEFDSDEILDCDLKAYQYELEKALSAKDDTIDEDYIDCIQAEIMITQHKKTKKMLEKKNARQNTQIHEVLAGVLVGKSAEATTNQSNSNDDGKKIENTKHVKGYSREPSFSLGLSDIEDEETRKKYWSANNNNTHRNN